MKTKIAALSVTPDLPLYHIGPALDHGPLPSLFYFSLSGPDSLCLDPFNQPVQFLQGRMIRIFSLTLPGHEADLPATNAINLWANDFRRGIDSIGNFISSAKEAIDFAVKEQFADPGKMGIAGLSRGAFLAAHVAAQDERLRFLLGFAPLTRLSLLKEFINLNADHLDVSKLAPLLCHRHCRFYIGNRDTRVGTRSCFELTMDLVAQAHEKKIRVPQIELFMTPSIGKDGHGTAPEIFRQGAEWIAAGIEKHRD